MKRHVTFVASMIVLLLAATHTVAFPQDDSAVTLIWDRGADADIIEYTIFRGEINNDTSGPLTSIGTVPQPSEGTDPVYLDDNVNEDKQYLYCVIARDSEGLISIPSNFAMHPKPSFLPQDAPSPVVNLTIVKPNKVSINIGN